MIFVTLLLTAQAAAAPGATSTTNDKLAVAADRKQVICVADTSTGSRLGAQRVCHTRAEWEQSRRDLANTLEQKTVQAGLPR